MISQKKQSQASDFSTLLKESPNFALISFDKTKHGSLEKLRTELKKSDASFRVIKNSIFQKTVENLSKKDKGLKELSEKIFPLKDNSALLSLKGDFIAGLSAFYKFTVTEKTLSFKYGFIDNAIYDANKLNTLAKLPPKGELIAKILGSLKSPQTRLVYSMKFNVSKLIYVLKERSKQSN